MDHDLPTALPFSSSKRVDPFAISSSPRKRTKVYLPDTQLAILNNNMNGKNYPPLFQTSESAIQGFLFKMVLMDLMEELQRTSMRDSFIPTPDIVRAKEILASFDDDELKQWTDGVQRGVEQKDWGSLLEHPRLKKTLPEDSMAQNVSMSEQEKATKRSWECTYQGEAAEALWMHIQENYNSYGMGTYACYCFVVQSSGMGKSRTVDQLGKSHFFLPINLRDAQSTGYPPADHEVRDFLTKRGSMDEVYFRISCFLEALFRHTKDTLATFDPQLGIEGVASKFRTSMTEGQTPKHHNEFRRKFYQQVIRKADRFVADRASGNYLLPHNGQKYSDPTQDSCHELIESLKARDQNLSSSEVAKKGGDDRPLVILAFDEARVLSIQQEKGGATFSNFKVLGKVLLTLRYFPLFSVLLSTTGDVIQPVSRPPDSSSRISITNLALVEPFTDFGFDTFASAKPVSVDGSWDLDDVIDNLHLTRLGRPLFGSRYDAGDSSVQDEIVVFAIEKLLNANHDTRDFTLDMSLACLSQRFPIDFFSTPNISRTAERKQVEAHLRVVQDADAAFENMVTSTPSEPLLSEAAYAIMTRGFFDPVMAFKSVLEAFRVPKGGCGEFLVLLLLTLARDLAVGPPNTLECPQSGRRSFNFASFLYGHLFSDRKLTASASALESLRQDFPDAMIHFNHFVKLHDFSSIDKESLLLLMTRGAGVLCANHQRAIDGINVFLKSGTKITLSNLGLLLWQVSNDDIFTDTPKPEVFESMDPYKLEILTEGDAAVPVIRIFFALAADTGSLHVTRHNPSPAYGEVIYDIWCAGLSPDFLNPIDPSRTGIWDGILQATYGWKEIYEAGTDAEKELRMAMTPGVAGDSAHWSHWAKSSAE